MQTVFYDVIVKLTKLLTPIIPHTSEEIWSYLKEEEEFVQLAELPVAVFAEGSQAVLGQWNQFMRLRDNVLKALETARNEKVIGKSFEAHLTLYVSKEVKELFESMDANLAQLFIVSQLDLKEEEESSNTNKEGLQFPGLRVIVSHAEGETCERCRAILPEVGTIEDAPTLCTRCANIVRSEFPEALLDEVEEEE